MESEWLAIAAGVPRNPLIDSHSSVSELSCRLHNVSRTFKWSHMIFSHPAAVASFRILRFMDLFQNSPKTQKFTSLRAYLWRWIPQAQPLAAPNCFSEQLQAAGDNLALRLRLQVRGACVISRVSTLHRPWFQTAQHLAESVLKIVLTGTESVLSKSSPKWSEIQIDSGYDREA